MPKKFEWGPEFSVGSSILDNQHKQLLRLSNDLADCCRMHGSEKSSRHHELLNELVIYAKKHFETEEAILEEIGFQELERHKMEHGDFEERLAQILLNATLAQSYVEDTAEFIARWCVEHVANSDMQYKQALTNFANL